MLKKYAFIYFDCCFWSKKYFIKFLSVVPNEIVDIKNAGKFCTSLDVTGGDLSFKFDVKDFKIVKLFNLVFIS